MKAHQAFGRFVPEDAWKPDNNAIPLHPGAASYYASAAGSSRDAVEHGQGGGRASSPAARSQRGHPHDTRSIASDRIRRGSGSSAQIYILFYPPIPMLARPLHVMMAIVLIILWHLCGGKEEPCAALA